MLSVLLLKIKLLEVFLIRNIWLRVTLTALVLLPFYIGHEHIHNYSDNVNKFDQLILYPTFIHVSFGPRNRHQVIDNRK